MYTDYLFEKPAGQLNAYDLHLLTMERSHRISLLREDFSKNYFVGSLEFGYLQPNLFMVPPNPDDFLRDDKDRFFDTVPCQEIPTTAEMFINKYGPQVHTIRLKPMIPWTFDLSVHTDPIFGQIPNCCIWFPNLSLVTIDISTVLDARPPSPWILNLIRGLGQVCSKSFEITIQFYKLFPTPQPEQIFRCYCHPPTGIKLERAYTPITPVTPIGSPNEIN